MPIRPATRSDIPAIAEIYAAAFRSDPLFRFLFPHIEEHPEAFVQAARENLTVAWYDFRQLLMVSYTREIGDEGQNEDERSALLVGEGPKHTESETLTGFAQWEQVGKEWEHVQGVWGWWDPRLLLKPAVSTFYRVRRYVWPNKATAHPTAEDPDPINFWNYVPRILPFTAHFFGAPHRQIRWSLEVLGVHPDHQGKGYGKELVRDGLLRAKKDPAGDLPVCVVAAERKEAFYLKVGFNEIVGYTTETVDKDGNENPLKKNKIGGGAVLWTK